VPNAFVLVVETDCAPGAKLVYCVKWRYWIILMKVRSVFSLVYHREGVGGVSVMSNSQFM